MHTVRETPPDIAPWHNTVTQSASSFAIVAFRQTFGLSVPSLC